MKRREMRWAKGRAKKKSKMTNSENRKEIRKAREQGMERRKAK